MRRDRPMPEILTSALSPKFLFLYAWAASVAYVHYRGRVRHRFFRQLSDHSTFTAPYSVLMYAFSAVPNRPFVDVNTFPELAPLAANWQTIRDEAKSLFDEGHLRAAAKHNDIGFHSFFHSGWKRFYVKWYDEPLQSAAALCPKTVALVQSIPTVNAALFALLPPGANLGAHRDPFAGSLRYHLGLITPNSPACHIVVDGEPYAWRDGEALLFDETFIHTAENAASTPRVILFCDVERPLRNRAVRAINRLVRSTIVRASQTANVEGEKIGFVNRIFAVFYQFRLFGKRIKAKSRLVYYALKWLLLGGLVFAIFYAL
jgi:beta-hydroxylase